MTFRVDPQAKYSRSHEWVRIDGGTATIGITDYAQHQLSDLVYVELPQVGDVLTRGKAFSVFESVKAAEEVYAPLSGKVLTVNTELTDHPDWVNTDPYGKGWLVQVACDDAAEYAELMDAAAYAEFIAAEEDTT